jgi:hypothetical protein
MQRYDTFRESDVAFVYLNSLRLQRNCQMLPVAGYTSLVEIFIRSESPAIIGHSLVLQPFQLLVFQIEESELEIEDARQHLKDLVEFGRTDNIANHLIDHIASKCIQKRVFACRKKNFHVYAVALYYIVLNVAMSNNRERYGP